MKTDHECVKPCY